MMMTTAPTIQTMLFMVASYVLLKAADISASVVFSASLTATPPRP